MKKLLFAFFVLAFTNLAAQNFTSATVVGRIYYQGKPLANTMLTCEATGDNWHAPLKLSSTNTDSTGYFTLQTLTGNNTISVKTPNSQTVNLPFTVYSSYYDNMLKNRLDLADF